MSLSGLLERSAEFEISNEKLGSIEQGRLDFIAKFPLEKLKELTVDEYVQGTDNNSFCYWLEFKKILFGIGGGNASKFGLYKAKDGNYYTNSGNKKEQLTGKELQSHFEKIKNGITSALKCASEDDISTMKELDIPIWNMVLQKILSLYYPDKFITIGSANVLITCARDIELNGISLDNKNLIEINYECKKLLSSQKRLKDWHYDKVGKFLWATYLDESNRSYYIIGSKYGGHHNGDVFPEMLEKSVVSIGFEPATNLEEVYSKKPIEIKDFLINNGAKDNKPYNALKHLLSLKVGDRIAVKADGSPKGSKGFLSIVGIAEVIDADGVIYQHDPDGLGHLINVEFIKAPVYKEFDLGGYGQTIHKLSKPEHIKLIFDSEYEEISLDELNKIPIEAQVIYAYLKKAMSQRDIQRDILKEDAPDRGGGYSTMRILREYNIKGDKKGVLSRVDFEAEYGAAEGQYYDALTLLREHYPEFSQPEAIEMKLNYPLNTILYGPPGTGKTYNTILRAAEIIEDRSIESYDEAKRIFNEQLGDRIEFITFHQNYSYEDFIQGLRPDTDNNSSLTFDRKDGVFKTISDRALQNLHLSEKAPDELTREMIFENALESFRDQLLDSEENYKINDTASIVEVESDAFRYRGENWAKSPNGNRMKFSDLREFYKNDVQSRKDVKKLESISGLANQHATYYFLVYKKISEFLKEQNETAKAVEKQNYVIVIDEINRANISRVFGELITLIEPDKRSHGEIPLTCTLPSGEKFIVPSNLFIIGTMNTADKSIALLDIALRRRFDFEAMYPLYLIDGKEIHDADILENINKKVIELKGHDFQIGHAYFMDNNSDLKTRMNKKVIPLLLEYFMNDEDEVRSILKHAGLDIEAGSWPLRING